MFSIWIADAQRRELTVLEACSRGAFSLASEEMLDCCAVQQAPALLERLRRQPLAPDLACVDLAMPEGFPLGTAMRRLSRSLFLVVVAPQELSPMRYLRPELLAGGLLLRPFTREQADAVLGDAVRFCMQSREETPDECFWLSTRNGRESVRYSDILYFEARGKHIFLVSAAREYPFSDTLDRLETALPGQFARCHRSFIVRLACIECVRLSAGMITLDSGETIPLSRTYKANLKGFCK